MKFKEAKIETSGCDARGKVYYRKTSRTLLKGECPSGKLRCCMFCNEECKLRCEMSSMLEKQPDGMRDRFDCASLRPSMEIAWKNLLGPNDSELNR